MCSFHLSLNIYKAYTFLSIFFDEIFAYALIVSGPDVFLYKQ